MPIPELLVGNVFISGAPQISELVGGTSLNAIGSLLSEAAADTGRPSTTWGDPTNRCIEYRGDIYALFYFGSNTCRIHRYNRPAGTWGVAAGTGCVSGNQTGLYIANTGSTQRIFSVSRNLGGRFQIAWADLGTVAWTHTDTGTSEGGTGVSPPCLFNNKLYQLHDGGAWEVDPVSLTAAQVTQVWDTQTTNISGDLCVFDDRLFALIAESGGTRQDFSLWEFTGGGWTLNLEITTDGRINGYSQVDEGQVCLFKDPGANKLIAICNGSNNGANTGAGSMAFELTPSGLTFTPNEITSTVIPAAFRPGVRGASNDATEDRWYGYSNNDVPGSPEFFLFFAQGPAPGTAYTVYQWVDTSTVMTSLGAGPSKIFTIPHGKFGGGARINIASGNQCAIESGTAVLGAYRINYRVYGAVASQSVRLYYDEEQESPVTQATIIAQTGGSGITANAVTGVTGDDGVTLFTVDWDLAADGVANGDAVHIMLDIS